MGVLLKNTKKVNEGLIEEVDVLIEDEFIKKYHPQFLLQIIKS